MTYTCAYVYVCEYILYMHVVLCAEWVIHAFCMKYMCLLCVHTCVRTHSFVVLLGDFRSVLSFAPLEFGQWPRFLPCVKFPLTFL